MRKKRVRSISAKGPRQHPEEVTEHYLNLRAHGASRGEGDGAYPSVTRVRPVITPSAARQQWYGLLKHVAKTGEPVYIENQRTKESAMLRLLSHEELAQQAAATSDP